MTEFGEMIEDFLSGVPMEGYQSPTCENMEGYVLGALRNLPKHHDWGGFYRTTLSWNPDKEEIDDMVDAAPPLPQEAIVFVKNDTFFLGEGSIGDYARRRRDVGFTNIVAVIVDRDEREYVFAATWRGDLTRPLHRPGEILPIFHQRLDETLRRQQGEPLPDWPPKS